MVNKDTEKWSKISGITRMCGLYYNCDYYAALRLSSATLKADPHDPTCLPVRVALLN